MTETIRPIHVIGGGLAGSAPLHFRAFTTTLGVGAMLLASAIFFTSDGHGGISLHELAILFFLFITAPVTAHLLAKAALHRQQAGVAGAGDTPDAGAETADSGT